jgi:hypothetical protein
MKKPPPLLRAANSITLPCAAIFAKPVMTSHYFVVEVVVPPGGLGRRLDNMHEFHRQRGLKDQRGPRRRDDEHDYLRWCFADLATAEAFAAEFGGEILQQKSRPHC